MEAKQKVRLGNGKKRGPQWLTAAICLSDCHAHAYTYNGKTYVNLNINIYDAPNEYGKDVAITLNDYKKDVAIPNMAPGPTAPAPYQAEEYDLPF